MKLILRVRVLALAAFLGYASSPSLALEEIARLAPSDANLGFGGGFGASVAISGDWIVVGAPLDDQRAHDAGAAYVYRRDGVHWIQHDKLMYLPLEEAKFGHSVAIDGDWIVIGSPDLYFELLSAGPGRAYVSTRDDRDTPDDLSDDLWDPVAFLNPPPSHLCCSFGISVDVEGDTIVVGSSPLWPWPPVGRAYVFRWDGLEWLPGTTLVGSDTEAGDGFGASVGTSGGLVLIGAPRNEYSCPGYDVCWGSAYVFRRNDTGWTEEGQLTPSDPLGPFGAFGSAIAIDDDVPIVGGSGAVYVYRRDAAAWTEEVKLLPSSQASGFGASVAIDGNRVIAAASGAVWGHLFAREADGWMEVHQLLGIKGSRWRPPVAVNGRYALVGTYVYAVGDSVSLHDYAKFQVCFATGAPQSPSCDKFDLEPDGRIDLSDYALFIQTWRGP